MSHRSTAAAVRMRAAVIGGSGQLGGWLLRVLAERGHDAAGTFATTAFPGLTPLDAADSAAAADWVRSQNPSVVFYPAGFTWVDGCERDPGKARAANVEQPLNLARAAAEVGARFVYFSTDYVFDGQDGPYAESAAPRPLPSTARPSSKPNKPWPTRWATCFWSRAPPGSTAPSGKGRISRTSLPKRSAKGVPSPALQTRSRPRATAPTLRRRWSG